MKSSYLKFVLVACFALQILHAIAQTDTTSVDLTDLSLEKLLNVKIVSASKTMMQASQAPASVTVVTEEQIRIRGYRSLLDVLMDVPDIKVDDKVYSISRNRITIRGVEGQEKFIIMLDGMRISSPTNETLPIMENYPVNLAKQIEIIYGPASALYGADALTGIINIISKKAEYVSSRSEASYLMGDNGLYSGSIFTSRKLNKDLVLTLSGQYFYDKGVDYSKTYSRDTLWDMTSHQTGTFETIFGPMTPREKVGPQYESPLMAYNIFAALKTNELDLSFFRSYSENSTAIENNPGNAVYNKDVFYGRSISSVSARYAKPVDNFTFVTSITASQYQANPNSNYRNMYSGMERAYKYGYGSMIRGEEQLEWKPTEKTNVVGGVVLENFFSLPESTDLQNPVKASKSVEGVFLNTPSYYRPEGLEAKFYSVKYQNIGGYLQVQQRLVKNATVTVGARFDHNSRFGSTFNPRMGVVWNVARRTTVKAMAGTAYLAPTPGSSYSYYGTFYTLDSGRTYRSNFLHLPNPKLKPMVSKNVEVSIRQYLGENFSFGLTTYYTRISNLLNFGADDGNTNLYGGKFLGWDVDYIEVFVNEGTEEVLGGSLNLAYNYSFNGNWLRAYANVSYVDGKEEDLSGGEEKVELDHISPWSLKSGIDISWKKFYASPRLIWVGRQRLEGIASDQKRQTIGGYRLVNLSLGYKMGNASVFANVTNLLNQNYRGSGPNMDLNNKSTELFYGNYQDPMRVNMGVKVGF
jgi:outer membrane receptor for ferrienterochelin and colicin